MIRRFLALSLALTTAGALLQAPAQAQMKRNPTLQSFSEPVEAAVRNLPRRGVRAYALRGDAPSESWLPAGGATPQVA